MPHIPSILTHFSPELILVVGMLLVLTYDLWVRGREGLQANLAIITTVLALVATLVLWVTMPGSQTMSTFSMIVRSPTRQPRSRASTLTAPLKSSMLAPPSQEPCEEGCTHHAGHDADRNLLPVDDRPGHRVGQNQRDGADDRAHRQQEAVRRSSH